MRIAVTGADGFIGRAVTKLLGEAGLMNGLRLVDRGFDRTDECELLSLDITDPDSAARVADGIDCVIHLAALPGAAAQANPRLSRAVNLDASLALMEAMAGKRFIYASSIAALGADLPDPVDDTTAAKPVGTYGTHKRMVELAFADMVARNELQGFALRLPGIVARPPSAAGFGSGFLSDIFHAARAGRDYEIPVAPEATPWLMSVDTCARNLVHAALSEKSESEPVNLPVLRVTIADLVAELGRAGSSAEFTYLPNAELQRMFAANPPLLAARAQQMGFESDGDLVSLVSRVMAHV